MITPLTELIITADGAEVVRKTLRPGDYVIGRESGCDVHLDVELVSRRHAQLIVNFDHVLIEDLGSSNGTFINGKPVTEATRLWPNQKIQIGAATIELHRLKASSGSDQSLAPQTAAVRRVLPDEFLRDRKYDIGGVIAQGGMGAILDAREATTHRTVAMKVMLSNLSEGDLLRFIEEAQITSQLEHPNIVPVHELGVDEQDQVFYTMKMVRGITLRKVLELMGSGTAPTIAKYPLAALLTILQKVCDALAFAHSKRVLHRDLKPENIMLGDFGEVLVMDWGLAKVMGATPAHGSPAATMLASLNRTVHSVRHEEAGSFTMAGTIVGTPHYMSPEQANGGVDLLDEGTDIWALGAILRYILALALPVGGEDVEQILENVRAGKLTRIPSRAPHCPGGRVPESLAAVANKAQALRREDRYTSVEEFRREIDAYLGGFATSAEHAGAWKQFALFVRRNKAASIGATAVFLIGTTFGTKAILEGKRAEREAAAAKATLADLRRTAPVFFQQARVVFDEGKLDEAMEKIGYAIQLDPAQPDYHLFRAHLLQSSQKLAEAAEGYRRVLTLRPKDEAAKINLALCEKLRQESGGGPLQRAQQTLLLSALREQRRLVEAAPLAKIIDPDVALARAAILARLREARKQPGWNANNSNLIDLPDGTFHVRMYKMAPIDFSVLRGQPVSSLDLSLTGIADLSSLAGLPLKTLFLADGKMTDLSPLRGMPLENLDLGSTIVTDLSPLRGMRLRKLRLWRAKVEDLSPLKGMPLADLDIFECKNVRDFSPLAGLPLRRFYPVGTYLKDFTLLSSFTQLEDLNVFGMPITDLAPLKNLPLQVLECSRVKITSIEVLRGKPLRFLNLADTGVTDLEPLSGCTTLEELLLPPALGKIDFLRDLPNLKRLSQRGIGNPPRPAQTPAEFWAEYDAQQAAGKK